MATAQEVRIAIQANGGTEPGTPHRPGLSRATTCESLSAGGSVKLAWKDLVVKSAKGRVLLKQVTGAAPPPLFDVRACGRQTEGGRGRNGAAQAPERFARAKCVPEYLLLSS